MQQTQKVPKFVCQSRIAQTCHSLQSLCNANSVKEFSTQGYVKKAQKVTYFVLC